MQRTRLNTIVEVRGQQLSQFFSNPWRRISLSLLAFLFGFFVGTAVATTAGQNAQWDVVCAAFVLLFCEFINRWFYRRGGKMGELRADILNIFKMGVSYSLFLEAFKLGS
ncbi:MULTISPECIES: DUF565 domain-containing protein [unclassified Synechocystis]|uniref:DUF565 domain-containing protein n=1 Tax=unclassified Synechocystis TaxID=2640012 RepID=UPI0004251CD9|nr:MULTISPECIES: DUF565 domain-containing protein [unclassified Synechocystis]AIE75067.1 putative membrane protein Ycf20 conserved in cyanobacteria [Synechocystis sp. PCC 6714]MCT0253231.1 DUF565 domain-containing protein [Synechocystis sp. CS-94]